MIPPVSMISQASKYLWWRRYGSWQAEVRKAFKEYRLTRKPCMICGTQNSEAHHADYDKPLDVDFLCQRHHLQFHARSNKEFLQRNRRRYSLAFHNQVLSEFRREYLQPELPL